MTGKFRDAFVTNPREVTAIFGSTLVQDGRIIARYTDELSLRRSIATIAHAYGWLVQEEVVVPGWGRIDLVLRDDVLSRPRLIELKLDLRKPAAIRRAFQQADGYGRWWAQHHNEANAVTLIGVDLDEANLRPVATAYPEVGWGNAASLLCELKVWDNPQRRVARMVNRRSAVRGLFEVYTQAQVEMDKVLHPDPAAEQAKTPATGPAAGVAGVDVAAPAHTPDP